MTVQQPVQVVEPQDRERLPATTGGSLEGLSRPFLEVLQRLTGLDSIYLTEVRADRHDQLILFAENRGDLLIEEGLSVEWDDSLCRRALESGVQATDDACSVLPGSITGAELGITSFASVPVLGTDGGVLGTLCGASRATMTVTPAAVDLMQQLAGVISERWERERQHAFAVSRADDAEQRLRDRALFLAEAEHRLKTRLTILRGWLEVLESDWTEMSDDERVQGLQILHRAADEASAQVDQLLDHARAEVVALQLALEPIRADVFVEQVAHEFARGAGERHSVVASATDPGPVLADRAALRQVLWQLAENAVKYSPDGGRIEIAVEAVPGSPAVRFTVADEGIGVPEGVDLFAPFTRGTEQQTGAIPGSGVGLHLVRTLVDKMQGTVRAERRPDRGSLFTLVLPRA